MFNLLPTLQRTATVIAVTTAWIAVANVIKAAAVQLD